MSWEMRPTDDPSRAGVDRVRPSRTRAVAATVPRAADLRAGHLLSYIESIQLVIDIRMSATYDRSLMSGQRVVDLRHVVVGNPWKNWVFVLVETEDGIIGLGEATLGVTTLPVLGALEELRAVVVGEDALQVEHMWTRMEEAWYLPTDPVHLAAMSAVEIACWDIAGKLSGVPLSAFFGGALRAEVPVYLNGWYRGERRPEVFAELASAAVEAGFAGLKLDPFGAARRTISQEELRSSVALVQAVKEVTGSHAEVMVDAHDRFDVATAIRVSEALEPMDLAWLEAPVASENMVALGAVAARSPVPIAAGERLTQAHQFDSLGGAGVQIWQPETLAVGGTRGLRRIAALAEAFGATLAPHNARGPVCTAVNLHLAAAIAGIQVLEYFAPGDDDLAARVTSGLASPVAGLLRVPDGPGHGITLDEAAAAAYPLDTGNVLRLFRPGWERRAGDTRQ
jgi:galactonate dehydratase